MEASTSQATNGAYQTAKEKKNHGGETENPDTRDKTGKREENPGTLREFYPHENDQGQRGHRLGKGKKKAKQPSGAWTKAKAICRNAYGAHDRQNS